MQSKNISVSIVSFFRSPRKLVISIAVIVAIAVACCVIFRTRPQSTSLPVVEIEQVRPRDVNIYGEYVGRIRHAICGSACQSGRLS